jgi:type II secretory pathway pseudopilin PulG
MRKEMLVAAVIFGGLAGYALSPLPSFAFETADQRERIAQPVAQPALAKPHQR